MLTVTAAVRSSRLFRRFFFTPDLWPRILQKSALSPVVSLWAFWTLAICSALREEARRSKVLKSGNAQTWESLTKSSHSHLRTWIRADAAYQWAMPGVLVRLVDRHALSSSTLLYHTLQTLHFLFANYKDIWQLHIKQVCWCCFSNSICSLSVSSCFSKSCSISRFFIVFVTVIFDITIV